MINIPDIRERIAEYFDDVFKDDEITICTEYQPVLENVETAICIQPVSLSAEFVDRQRYKVEPKIAVTVQKRIGDDREEAGDYVLELVGRVLHSTLGVGFGGAIVRTVDISDPILAEDNISGNNVAVSRLTLSLYAHENRS